MKRLTRISDEIKGLFDVEIDKLYGLIDEQLGRMQIMYPHEQIVELAPAGSRELS